MRKTRLLLGALERLGCQDVTFAALDLCQDALTEALTALRGEYPAHCVGHSNALAQSQVIHRPSWPASG